MSQLMAVNERGRRSSRVLVSLALAVSGQKSDGSHVSGAAETILVNRHGAKIRSTVPLEPKMEVRVAMLAPYKWRVGQVVWADSGESEYGIELFRPENFWGIYFPPEDWELGVPAVTVGNTPPAATELRAQTDTAASAEQIALQASTQEALSLSQQSSSQQSLSQQEAQQSSPQQSLELPEGGTIAILRGIASNGLPFQVRDLILPVGERDATMLINPLVSLGSKLQVIFSKNCVEDAIVTATSHNREYDRWRIWLNFSRVLLVAKPQS